MAILNQKGGVGKTTTTINLGAYLSKQGKKVLLVDADPQSNTTSGLGLTKREHAKTLCDVLLSGQEASSVVQKTNLKNLFLIPADPRLASAEVDLAGKQDREHMLKNKISGLEYYDYILIDCPPALSLLTINVLVASDLVLIPVQAEYYALEGLSQLLQVMQSVKRSFNPNLELLGVAVTMFDKRTSLSEQVYSELKENFGDKLFKTVIPRNIRLAEAPSFGKPISEHDKWSKGARAYKNLAKELTEKIPKSDTEEVK
ncbi:ParA family protein [Candidatus Saccharibacteria bacterium]|nr:ParA family protein [Candidatus Saccharibacteria bacterium]